MLLKIGESLGKKFIVFTDKYKKWAQIKQQNSWDNTVNKKCKVIQNIPISQKPDIHPHQATSQENKADSLSRGILLGHFLSDRMELKLPSELEHAITQF